MAQSSRKRRTPAIQLYRFKWSGKSTSGRNLSGEMVSRSKTEVGAELKRHDIIIRRVRKKSSLHGRGRIKAQDIAVFARQLATMIRAGVPLLQALQIVTESIEKPSMVLLVQQMIHDVSAGASFSDALRRHPRHFDHLFINLVEAGEQAGALDQMLERIATYKEKVEMLKGRIKKAMWYPAAVMTIGISITMLLLIKVVPQFEDMFHNFGAELPAMTQVTLRLSELAQTYWLHALGGLAAGIFVLRRAARRSPRLAYRLHFLLLRLPVIGSILQKSAVARFSRTLATTFAAGVPLVEALQTCSGATGNKVYQHAVIQARQDVSTGQPLHFAMRMTNQFPSLVVQMISIGEESGALDAMLNRVADYYEEEVDNKVDALTSLMEPVIIVVLGLLVGGVVVSMYLPIINLGTAL
ncbi:MAG: type II secretion system F family protein [Halomonas sp.]|nr:type II secretion system F family protein [Halomonas sp.]MDN6298425.1 type II secretion system F family protein [Halomonas sp.]MDN6313673.1 type II secretion system F family protein [Halomonas sp.]MDN6337020.1 type II secretion system F family protein [Halomonas sp.]